MKNTVDEAILALTEEEVRNFKYFIERKGHTGGRADLQMINIIRKDVPGTRYSNAQLQIKKRLKRQLEQFATFDNIRNDHTSQLHSLIEMAKFLFRKNLYSHAWDYLFKAEQLAIDQEEYQLLDFIYDVEISYLSTLYISDTNSPDINSLLEKREKNLSLAKRNGDINAAYSLLIHKIREVFCKDMHADIDELVNGILERYNLHEDMYESPKTYYRMVNIVCRTLREKKDYYTMKEYAMAGYRKMEEQKMIERIGINSLMELVKSILYSALRTKDYKSVEKFLQINEQNIEKIRKQNEEYINHEFLNVIALCDLFMCTNRLPEAKQQLLLLHRSYQDNMDSSMIFFTLRINLIAMHFKCCEYNKAISFYNELMQQREWKFLNIGGLELVLFTEIYGAICYYETDDTDYASRLLGKIKRKYAGVLNKTESARERFFISIADELINNPSYRKSSRFTADHKKFVRIKEYIPADKEYISLNAWLTAKATGRSYYECFLDIAGAD